MLVKCVAYNHKGFAVSETALVEVPAGADIMEMFEATSTAEETTYSRAEPVWLALLDEQGNEISGCDC